MLFRCINYTASDYLKENSAIKLTLWAQNKGNCQKESVHPKSHEKKNNWQAFSACSFIECSLSLLMFNQPPPLAQIKSENGRTGGGNAICTAFEQQVDQIFQIWPQTTRIFMGDLEGRLFREGNCDSMQNKIRMLDSGLCSVLQNSSWKFSSCHGARWGNSPLPVQVGTSHFCIVLVLKE